MYKLFIIYLALQRNEELIKPWNCGQLRHGISIGNIGPNYMKFCMKQVFENYSFFLLSVFFQVQSCSMSNLLAWSLNILYIAFSCIYNDWIMSYFCQISRSFHVKSSDFLAKCNPTLSILFIFISLVDIGTKWTHTKFEVNISNGYWFMAGEKFLDFTASASLNFTSGKRPNFRTS